MLTVSEKTMEGFQSSSGLKNKDEIKFAISLVIPSHFSMIEMEIDNYIGEAINQCEFYGLELQSSIIAFSLVSIFDINTTFNNSLSDILYERIPENEKSTKIIALALINSDY